MSPDYYHAPALILTALLLPAFGYLYLRSRNTRTLLWFSGFICSLAAMALLYFPTARGLSGEIHPWMAAAGQTALLIGTAMFLGSLSPVDFALGRFRILYVVPYTAPLVIYSVLLYGIYGGRTPSGAPFLLLPILGILAFAAVFFWSMVSYAIPRWLNAPFTTILGGVAFWAYFAMGAAWALTLIEAANLLMTALLIGFLFRRLSPGVLLGMVGFAAWSLFATLDLPVLARRPALELHLLQVVAMSKVVAAIGMILLALEDEIALNKAAEERERRARRELEAYSKTVLSRRRLEDFDRQGSELCQLVAANSRFAQVALLLNSGGHYGLAGAAGLNPATARALGDMAARLHVDGFLAPGSAPPLIEQSQTMLLDLSSWLTPGDDLKRLGFTTVLAVPMVNRSVTEGAFLLADVRPLPGTMAPADFASLRAEDLLPIEMLAGRLQATRSQTTIFEKLIDSEKFGHLGQLASNVAQQLNNPLTVILGYASLLDGTGELNAHDSKAVEAILAEARHMRGTLESLSRVSGALTDEMAAVSVAEMLSDLGELHRQDFLQRSIDFHLKLEPGLPRVLCSPQQLRQAVRHCLQFAIEAVENPAAPARESRSVSIEASTKGDAVEILVAHSGPGFPSPERAFDPFMPPQVGRHSAGLGLSLCATILRDNQGRASAVNFEPRGAGIILELKAA